MRTPKCESKNGGIALKANVRLPRTVFASQSVLLALLLTALAACVNVQDLPAPEDTRQSMLREAMLGLLAAKDSIPETTVRRNCLKLPVASPNDRLLGPHGDSLISSHCEIVGYETLASTPPARWSTARYRWTSLFTAEDSACGPTARDTITEEEVVLFEASGPGSVRAVWHARFETGAYAIWALGHP